MPRYHFNSEDGHLVHDRDGVELADPDAARLEAARRLGSLLLERPQTLWESSRCRMVVTNDKGLILFTIEVNTVTGAAVLPWPRREMA